MNEPGHDTERDPTLDAAWREASREEPPVALDEAIRAAARRAVGAAPRRARDKHWWYPLAAAATVAVIAIGLLQLTPPQQVAPTVVADMGNAPETAQRETAGAPAPRRDAAAAPQPAPETPAPAKTVREVAPQSKTEPPSVDKVARTEAGTASGTIAPPVPPPAISAPRSEPFPAAPPAAAPPAAAPAPRREVAAADERQMRNQAALAKDAGGEFAKPRQVAARSVDDWIRLIRDLRLQGKLADATKELAAFRDAYGERADSLLPPDLRELKPQAPAAGAK